MTDPTTAPSPDVDKAQRSRDPAFWETLYQREETGWDLGGPSPVLEAALGLGFYPPGSRILVPGAGRGHDALLLAAQGHDVTAIDFSASAVAAMRSAASERRLPLRVEACDLFTLRDRPAGSFDGAFEYTCFVAIDPALREAYVALLTHLLRPGGRLLFLAFPLGKTTPGPPHGLTLDELRERFGARWRWVLDGETSVSPDARREHERWVLLERNP